MQQPWVALLSELMSIEKRAEVVRKLASELGADEVMLLVEDPEVEAYLPARGLLQKLPRGKSWSQFIQEVAHEGQAKQCLPSPEGEGVVTAWGRRVSPGFLVILLGSSVDLQKLDACAAYLQLLSSAFRMERTSVFAQTQAHLAKETAEQARTLAKELDGARRALQDALREAQHARSRASLLAEVGTLFSSSLDVRTVLESVMQVVLGKLCDACVVELSSPSPILLSAAVRGAEALVEDGYLASPARREHVQRDAPRLLTLRRGAVALGDGLAQAHVKLLEERKATWALFVPLVARSSHLGNLTLLSASELEPSPDDLYFAEELARRAALSVDNARLYHEAQMAIQSRDEFLSVASHELRTPLTGLKLGMHNLQRAFSQYDASKPKAEFSGRIEALSRQTHKLAKLVEQLLDVTRLRAGKLNLELERMDMAALVREQVERLKEAASQSHVEFQLDAQGAVYGRWDRIRVEQVLTNLLTNALKYGAGKPVQVRVSQMPEAVRVDVVDRGIGIAPEDLGRIFKQFERAVMPGSYEGLGLGLYITRQLVEAHGGVISAKSTPGEGSAFTVELPYEPPARHPLPSSGADVWRGGAAVAGNGSGHVDHDDGSAPPSRAPARRKDGLGRVQDA